MGLESRLAKVESELARRRWLDGMMDLSRRDPDEWDRWIVQIFRGITPNGVVDFIEGFDGDPAMITIVEAYATMAFGPGWRERLVPYPWRAG
jgi:hypothetical protein